MNEQSPASAQCVILAGGKGERMRPYTEKMPKPMFQIGGKPILWHIMKYYQHFGVNRFVLCLGYKGDKIRDYFESEPESWSVDYIDTGENTIKGERLRQARPFIDGDEFFLAYGDDLCDVDLAALTSRHHAAEKLVTLTVVPLISSFGVVDMNDEDFVLGFTEKPKLDYWINGGFFRMSTRIFDFLDEGMDLEKDLLPLLSEREQVVAFKHKGFWNPLNTTKDTQQILRIWASGDTPWKVWD